MRPSAPRPTRHCDDADFADGLATRTSTIKCGSLCSATNNVTGRKIGVVLLLSYTIALSSKLSCDRSLEAVGR